MESSSWEYFPNLREEEQTCGEGPEGPQEGPWVQHRHLRGQEHGVGGRGGLGESLRCPTQALGCSGHGAEREPIPAASGSPRRRCEASGPGQCGSTCDGWDPRTPTRDRPGTQSRFL